MSILTRWEPLGGLRSEVTRFQQEVDRMFDRWGFALPHYPALAVSYPAINVWEDDEFVFAEAELPGLELDDLEISVTRDSEFTIKGTRKQTVEPEKATWHRQERDFGAFTRTITLPCSVNAEKVTASLERGILTIKMAKSEAAKTKRIPVKAE